MRTRQEVHCCFVHQVKDTVLRLYLATRVRIKGDIRSVRIEELDVFPACAEHVAESNCDTVP